MPILSSIDQQNRMLEYVPARATSKPTFGETVSAGFSFVRDEELSISSSFYNEGYYNRRRDLKTLSNEGFDVDKYIDNAGIINYDRISQATEGRVKTDLQLYQERNSILRKRREENQDVMARGSGLGQFFGMTAGYMTDPINIATLPIGGIATAGKGMSVLAQALKSARNTAAVAVASEAAIQPFVYKHKQDIDSPYDIDDSIRAITFAAVGSAVLGGALGGISGYLRKLTEDSTAVLPVFPKAPFVFKPTMINGKPTVAPTFENINNFKSQLIVEEKAKLIGKAGEVLPKGKAKDLQGELKNLEFDLKQADKPPVNIIARKGESVRVAKQRVVKEEKARIQDRINRVTKEIERNDFAKKAQSEISRLDQGILTESTQKKLDNFILQKSTPETESIYLLARFGDNLRAQKGFRAEEVFTGAFEKSADNLAKAVDGGKTLSVKEIGLKAVDARLAEMKAAKANANDIAKLEDIRNRIASEEGDGAELLQTIRQENINLDASILRENEAFRQQMDNYTVTQDMFVGPPKPPAPKAQATNLERSVLDADGMGKNFDEEMANYNRLEAKYAIVDGKIVDSAKIIKELDDDLDGLESIMRCSIG
jgi:hypothetical protein